MSDIFIIGNIVIDTLIHTDGSITKNAGGPPSFFLNYFSMIGKTINILSCNPIPPTEYTSLNSDIAELLSKSSNSFYTSARDYTRFTLDYRNGSKARQLYLSAFSGEIDIDGIRYIPENSTVILSPVYKEISEDFLRVLTSRTDLKLVIDPQGFFREINTENRIELSNSFEKIPFDSFSIIKFSCEDINAVIRTKLNKFAKYLEILLNDYNSIILLSLGERGAVLLENDFIGRIPALTDKVIDETGAGDTFLAALIDNYSTNEDLISAFKYASAVVSCFIEKRGFNGLDDRKEINVRKEECTVENISNSGLKDLIRVFCL